MSDRDFIIYCAPTLANIKTASLFNCQFEDRNAFERWMKEKNRTFNRQGLCMSVLHYCKHCALVYLFRAAKLREVLCDPAVRAFLENYGYNLHDGMYTCLRVLKARTEGCCSADFPHEIGIFLGYPLADVEGFIVNNGEGYKAFGMWKVYGDVEKTCACFERYEHCSRVYEKVWQTGRRCLSQMTVQG